MYCISRQDTWLCVSGQERPTKKNTRHTCVSFTGTIKLPISAPHTYLKHAVQPHISSMKGIGSVVCKIYLHFKISSDVHYLFLLFCTKLKLILKRIKTTFLYFDFFQSWHTCKECKGLCCHESWRNLKLI